MKLSKYVYWKTAAWEISRGNDRNIVHTTTDKNNPRAKMSIRYFAPCIDLEEQKISAYIPEGVM